MSDLQKAADDIQSLASKFTGIIAVADVLAKAGSVDQLVKESAARADAAKVAEQAAVAAHAEVQTLLTGAKVELASVQVQAAAHIESAHSEYDKIVGEAHVEGQSIVDEAKKIGAEIEAHFAKVKAEAVAIEQKIAEQFTAKGVLEEKTKSLEAHIASFFHTAKPS